MQQTADDVPQVEPGRGMSWDRLIHHPLVREAIAGRSSAEPGWNGLTLRLDDGH